MEIKQNIAKPTANAPERSPTITPERYRALVISYFSTEAMRRGIGISALPKDELKAFGAYLTENSFHAKSIDAMMPEGMDAREMGALIRKLEGCLPQPGPTGGKKPIMVRAGKRRKGEPHGMDFERIEPLEEKEK